jgi:hypothetical protein
MPFCSMNAAKKTLVIGSMVCVFMLCAVLLPHYSAGDYYIAYGRVFQYDSSSGKYLPANGVSVRLVCSTGTYYDTTHYNPNYGNGFYDFMASEVGRPDGGTVTVTYSQTFEDDDIPARLDFYIQECQSSIFLLSF